jgi:hypothetical protein
MSILSDIGAWLLGIGSDVLNFFKAAITAVANNPQLVSIAMTAVQNAENLAISGAEKQVAAYGAIAGQLAAAGLPAIASQINLAIETAVQSLQASSTGSAVTDASTNGTVATPTAEATAVNVASTSTTPHD